MTRFRAPLAAAALLFAAAALPAQTDPRQASYQFFVDGNLTVGIIGAQITFNHSTVARNDARQIDTAFMPDQRYLALSVTQQGLNRLQDILNSASSTGAPSSMPSPCRCLARATPCSSDGTSPTPFRPRSG